MNVTYSESLLDRDVERLATPIEHPAESLVDAHEAGSVRALLALTDKIERHRSGDAPILPPESDYTGNYQAYVDAPFGAPVESRFSNGTFGVLYAAFSLDTAAREALYWLTRFFENSQFAPGTIGRKQHLRFRLCGQMADLRIASGGTRASTTRTTTLFRGNGERRSTPTCAKAFGTTA